MKDLCDLGFFLVGTFHTTCCCVKCGNYSTMQTNTTYLCEPRLREAFKALP